MLTIIASVIVFGLLIGVHEAGHLISAKLCKIKVHEFSIGMGMKIFSFNTKETKYSLRLLPIGGYCKMEGEDEESDSPDAFCNKTPIQKILVLVSGALMNIILGFLALCIIFCSNPTYTSTYVGEVLKDAPAITQGLKKDDKIIEVNNKNVNIIDDIFFHVGKNKGENIKLTVLRNNTKVELDITPFNDNGRYIIGYQPLIKNTTFYSVVRNSFYESIYISKIVLLSLKDLFTGALSINQASGPVGIVKEIGSAAKLGILNLLFLLSVITINLGLFNLLPLPALDGGRVIFSLIELITHKKVSEKIEGIVHTVGFALLILIMLYVTFNDIAKI